MIYPKDILDFIKSEPDLTERFPHLATIDSINTSPQPPGARDLLFEQYMLNEGHLESRAIRKYLHFAASSYDLFNEIYRYFPKTNPNSSHKDDVSSIGTAPGELFHHALYLYYLDSWGVEGDVMECGTFKGYSACCLSWVCDYLGRKLIVADSFEGLPENDTDPYYQKGNFLGHLDEVRANIEDFGKIEKVEFVKGFFDTSLQGFKHKLCLLWMDVDLFESTTDILDNVFPCIAENGVIISHELFEDRDFENFQLKPTLGPAKALCMFLSDNGISYLATPLENGSGLVIPNLAHEHLLYARTNIQYLRDHCRQSDATLESQRVALTSDILHWKHECDKLMQVYRSTLDHKVKRAVKLGLSKVGLHRGEGDN